MRVLKKICNIILKVIVAIASIAFVVMPFLHNAIDRTIGQWIWYPSLAIFLVNLVIPRKNQKNERKSIKTLLSGVDLLLLFAMSGVFVINYYTTRYNWYWLAFVLFALIVPIGCVAIKLHGESKNTYSTEQIKAANARLGKYILFYWLIDLFYMACFNNWLVWQFIFGGMAMLIVFSNLTISFLSQSKASKWLLLTDFILGVGLTIYLIYIIPDSNLRNIVVSIISAIYGGLLTLVGVAWTIKQNRAERKRDEVEINKPIIFPFNSHNDFDYKKILDIQFVDDKVPNYNVIGMIKNTDKAILIIKEIVVDETVIPIKYGDVLDKNMVAQIIIITSKKLEFKSVVLVGSDICGNLIKYEIELNDAHKEIKGIRLVN